MDETALSPDSPPSNQRSASPAAAKPQPSVQLRIKFFLTGIVFPILCILGALQGMPTADRPWQSGELRHYVVLLLQWPGFGPLLPLIAMSATCLGVWVVRPATSRHLLIQMGIFTGAILSAQFLIYIFITTAHLTLIAAAIVGAVLAGIVWTLHWIATHVTRFTIRHLMMVTAAVALLIALLQLTGALEESMETMLGMLFFIIAAGPTLTAVTYARATYLIVADVPKQSRGRYRAAWIGWLVAWGATWKLSVDVMLDEYSKLPITDPNCYVSTAAAHGHPRLVGGDECGGVNAQTRRLKFLELSLAAAFPQCHRRVRRVYDWLGPPLARVCRANVWIADASYLMLKPLEWIARLLAKVTDFCP